MDYAICLLSDTTTETIFTNIINANRLVAPFSQPVDEGYYLPNQWVPHTALSVKLNPAGMKMAFDIAMQHFSFLRGRSTRLILAECNPFKEVWVWDLERIASNLQG